MLTAVSVSAQAPLDIRVALIIGNSAYAGQMALLNPANDAKDMADVLKRLGFTVIELRDGNKAQMAAAIAKVSDSLKGKQGVGMFYYAGHGLQLDWRNYMVPVDANVKTPGDVLQQTIDMSSVIDVFKAAGNRMSILVLDACRNNPFGGNTSTGKGLAQLDAPPSTFLAYATAPGNVAEDGDEKSGNGLYTQFLLQELKRPITRIEDVFKRVRLNVRKQSNGRQIPWESTSLEEDFFFNDGVKYTIKPEDLERMAAEVRAAEQKRLAQEAEALERIKQLALAKERERQRQQDELREIERQRAIAEARTRERDRLAAEAQVAEKERLAAEVKALEQQRLAAEARLKEAERISADAKLKEQQKLVAEAKAIEERRLVLQNQARERERVLASEQAKESERQVAEARSREQQRVAQEAQARERERLLAIDQAKERERLATEAQVREQQRLAEVLRLQEIQRITALIKAPSPRLSKEETQELLYKQEKAAWDLIKTSNSPDDFYNFLQRFPSGGNFSESAQYRLDQLATPKIAAALGKGQDARFSYTGPRFKVGDIYQFQVTDILTKVPGGITSLIVTGIEGDVVKFNDSSYVATVLSATIKSEGDEYDPPYAGLPVELQVGKKWTGQSSIKLGIRRGRVQQLKIESRITGIEEVVVPAGVFQTYVVETFVTGLGQIRRKEWIDPRYGVAVKSEEIARASYGIYRSDRRELIAIKADRGL